LAAFAVLLFISFALYFAWAFFEPQLLFYVFDDLGWTTTQFGLAAGGYGLASVLGQTTLGQAGDRYGRKPCIVIGLILFCAQFASLILTPSMAAAVLCFAVGGLGEGLVSPALSAFYLDITEEQHRARVMGIRLSAGSLGGVLGPLLAAAIASRLAPQGAFAGSIAIVLLATLLAIAVLREPRRLAQEPDAVWEISGQRATAAQGSLRGLVAFATLRRRSGQR
jgi:DHA1 family multidrug resistance protein-like MFS transporter